MSAIIQFTTGVAGTGKTYRRGVHFLINSFLKDYDGKFITNMPLFPDKIAEHFCKLNPQYVEKTILERIVIIPKEDITKWLDRESGPWDYFGPDYDLSGCAICIDEIHNFVGTSDSKEWVNHWKKFNGELRHRGVLFADYLSQSPSKVADCIKKEAGLRRELFNWENRRDPFLGIRVGDWYELRAAFNGGSYSATVTENEKIEINGKWSTPEEYKPVNFKLMPELFPLYDSYSAPIAGGKKASGPPRVFLRLTKLQMVIWFLRRNSMAFGFRLLVLVLFIWLTFFGGFVFCFNGFLKMVNSSYQNNGGKSAPAASGPSSSPGAGVGPAAAVSVTSAAMEIQRLNGIIKQLEAKVYLATSLRALTQESAIFDDGSCYFIGEEITSGPFKGLKIKAINFRRRSCTLSDGQSLSLASH